MELKSQVSTISKQCDIALDIQSFFWQQWQQYRDHLYRCCIKWTGNPTDAEDALSRAMLKAWEKVQKYAGEIVCNSLCVGALSPPSKTESATSAKCFTGRKSSGAFKKNIIPAVLTFQNYFGKGKRLRYLCQDETRLGLKTLTGKVIRGG